MRLTDSFVVGDTIIEIALADITTVTADVIVNSMCDYLHYGTGVSGAILAKAGEAPFHSSILPKDRFPEAGTVIPAPPGNLDCRHVFHAISSKCGEGTTAEILTKCTQAALDLTRDHEADSIALPAFGTGVMRFDTQNAAVAMIKTAVNDCKVKGGISRILFCLLRPDAFTAFFREAVKASVQEESAELLHPSEDSTEEPTDDKGRSLLSQLGACQPGKQDWGKYEDHAIELFQYLFVPPLSEPRIQSSTASGLSIRDAVFSNTAENGFWHLVDRRYTAPYVVVECKNYRDNIGQDAVNQVSRYLRRKTIGKVGFLASRLDPSDQALEARREVFDDLQHLVVFLSDFDFSQLVELKRLSKPPEQYIQQKIDDFALAY